MNHHSDPIKAVPTNVITGFLGVGKTTAILHLLKSKPENENWAVLVNEFGEIGVDGSLFAGQHSENQGVFIKEVPGGCMCCAAGLPMQIALNQLIARAKPDRLIIEPTGLGHPAEVLDVLTSESYQHVLDLQKTVTLVDARKLKDERYTNHETFNQQIDIADIVVGNKADLYEAKDADRLSNYVNQRSANNAAVYTTQQGELDPSLLAGPSVYHRAKCGHHHHHDSPSIPLAEEAVPETGFIKAQNEGEGFHSLGWRFSPNKTFNKNLLFSFLSGLEAERMKAVFITDQGIFGYNLTSDALTEVELDDCFESRIEIIARDLDENIEAKLMECIA